MSATAAQGVLLAHSYFLHHDPKQVRKMKPYPPLATLITASLARAAGHPVSLFDAMLADGEADFAAALEAQRPAFVGILEDNFNFLTKMCTVRMREATLTMIAMARRAGCRVAVNGSDAADHPELYLSAGADAVILGETELSFLELLALWREGPASADSLRQVRGLALAAPAGVVRTPTRPFLEHLDSLPFPAWDLVDVERYRTAWRDAHGRFSWNAVTTRGCPFACNWCAKPLYGTRYAQRSPENVAAELRRLKDEVAPDHVWFADDIFGLSNRWIERFAEAVQARDARIPFSMQSRVDLMTPSGVDALARSGCEEVWMGVESGSQRILDAMDKGTSIAQVRQATRLLKERGVRASWFLQLGYSGEEWDDILLTRELLREERPDDVGVSVAYPLPGTLFFDRVKGQLGAKANWTDSDDLAMMFEGTFSGAFYRRVRDLLHEEAAVMSGNPTSAVSLTHPGLSSADAAAFDARWEELATEQDVHRTTRPELPQTPLRPPSESGPHPSLPAHL